MVPSHRLQDEKGHVDKAPHVVQKRHMPTNPWSLRAVVSVYFAVSLHRRERKHELSKSRLQGHRLWVFCTMITIDEAVAQDVEEHMEQEVKNVCFLLPVSHPG